MERPKRQRASVDYAKLASGHLPQQEDDNPAEAIKSPRSVVKAGSTPGGRKRKNDTPEVMVTVTPANKRKRSTNRTPVSRSLYRKRCQPYSAACGSNERS